MRRSRLLLAAAAFASTLASVATAPLEAQAATSAPTVVIIVRHADKAAEPANDPPLTATGVERAAALAEFLRDAQVDVVFSTNTTRTRETARPTAERFKVTPQLITGAGMAGMTASVVSLVKANAGKTILIAGHSNTVMPWIAALGGPKRPDLCDHQYDGIYMLVISEGGTRLVEGRYGPPNPAPTAPCASMPTKP